MSTLARSATLQGSNEFPWQGFPIGSTVSYALTAIDPATDLPLNLAGQVVIFTLSAIDARGLPVLPALISRQAAVVSAPAGTCTVSIASGDTAPVGAVLAPGYYAVDAWVEDTSGNRLSGSYGLMYLSPCVRIPNAPVTPLPGQTPIAGVPLPLVAGFLHTDGTSMDWAAGSGGGGTPIADPDGTNTGQAVVLTGILPATLGWGFPRVPSYTTGARPAAASLPMGMIWNTTLECLQFSNGTTWFSVVMEAP